MEQGAKKQSAKSKGVRGKSGELKVKMKNGKQKVESRKLTRKAEIGKQKAENKPISDFYFLLLAFPNFRSEG
jgi:hypothetical protein